MLDKYFIAVTLLLGYFSCANLMFSLNRSSAPFIDAGLANAIQKASTGNRLHDAELLAKLRLDDEESSDKKDKKDKKKKQKKNKKDKQDTEKVKKTGKNDRKNKGDAMVSAPPKKVKSEGGSQGSSNSRRSSTDSSTDSDSSMLS